MKIMRVHFCVCVKTIVIICVMNAHLLVALKQNLFASLSQLKLLWQNDLDIVKLMEPLMDDNSSEYVPLKRYVKQHRQQGLNQTPNIDHLGHPINAYHLLRHVVYGWEYVSHHLSLPTEQKPLSNELDLVRKRNTNVDEDDINGAAAGIARLFSEYSLDQRELIKNGRLVTTMENGINVRSKQSVAPLDGFDLCKIAGQALHLGHFHTSVVFYDYCVNRLKKDEYANMKIRGIFKKQHLLSITSKNTKKLLNKAMKRHDYALEQLGQSGKIHRCNSKPFRGKFVKSVKYPSEREITPLAVDTSDLWYYNTNNITTDPISVGSRESTLVDKLCRGGKVKMSENTKGLKCFRAHANSEWLHLGPMKIQTNSHNPFHAVIKELLFTHECENIQMPLGRLLDKRSKDEYGAPAKYFEWTDLRVMKNVQVDERSNIVYDKINRRIEHLTDLHADSRKQESEYMLCGNYGIGGSYWTHVDKNNEGMDGRAATVVSIIESPTAGGATIWPFIGVSVFPEKGDGIYWYNLLRNSNLDGHSGHKACPIILGEKWICNKWIGYNAQWKKDDQNCGLAKEARFYPSFQGLI